MKAFLGEVVDPIKHFYTMRKKEEKYICVGIPLFIGIICYVVSFYIKAHPGFVFREFCDDILNQLITMLTLFISFSMAYLSIILTSGGKNIDDMKGTLSEIYELKNKRCTQYQVLANEITYTLVMEIIFLLFAMFQKFLFIFMSSSMIRLIVVLDIIFFVHILILMLVIVKNIYYYFWRSHGEEKSMNGYVELINADIKEIKDRVSSIDSNTGDSSLIRNDLRNIETVLEEMKKEITEKNN